MVDIELHDGGWHRYLLKSVEDGELCWWENVGIFVYNQKRVDECPSWKWSDKQFAFSDRWNKVLRQQDAYIVLSAGMDFEEDGSVTIGLRERFGGMRDDNVFNYKHTFNNWKKTTMKDMVKFYLDGCEAKKELDEHLYGAGINKG